MAYSMFGKSGATPPPPRAAKPVASAPAKQSPEHEMAYQRVLRLTTSPATAGKSTGYAPITHHDVHFHHVLDVLATGVNQIQDRGDVSQDTLDRMNGSLHSAMLHLDAHSAAARRSRFDEAAGHLNEAASHLGKVADQVGRHLGKTITHVDGSQYPTGFLKEHVNKLSKHYAVKEAKNDVTNVSKPADRYELPKEDFSDKRKKIDTSAEANVMGRVTHLDTMKVPEPTLLPRTLLDKRPTNTVTSRQLSPAEEKLAGMAPIMSRRDHVLRAYEDLRTTGKMGKKQLAALKPDEIVHLHNMTGVEVPAKYSKTPLPGSKAPVFSAPMSTMLEKGSPEKSAAIEAARKQRETRDAKFNKSPAKKLGVNVFSGDGDGAETMELQAYRIMQNATLYRGSHACSQCGIVMDPVQAMYNAGICTSCKNDRNARRVKGKMA